jgi:hypothetical protein
MEKIRIRDPGWKKLVRDKHLGFATLLGRIRNPGVDEFGSG